MSDNANLPPTPPASAEPTSPPPPAPAAPRPPEVPRRGGARTGSTPGCLFAVSVLLNIGAALVIVLVCCVGFFTGWGVGGVSTEQALTEKVHSGPMAAKDKVAIILLNGVIMEGALNYVHKQIEQAAKDKSVKAVVLRINSPGGSITASDDLHHRLVELRDGNKEKKYDGKPIVVSMGAMAASGGYYVAMPAAVVYAEKTTMTGSVGVYAAFPDVAGFAAKHEVGMNIIKAGDIKDSGSPFKKMSERERQVWQDMIDHAYDQFLEVVVDGRKDKLTRENLLEKFEVTPLAISNPAEKAKPYQRNLADGGIWTSDAAKKHKLIDNIGTLEEAITAAHDLAKMSSDYKAIEYEKPKVPIWEVMYVQSNQPDARNTALLDPAHWRNALTPRVWYLAPGCEFAGLMAAMEADTGSRR